MVKKSIETGSMEAERQGHLSEVVACLEERVIYGGTEPCLKFLFCAIAKTTGRQTSIPPAVHGRRAGCGRPGSKRDTVRTYLLHKYLRKYLPFALYSPSV